MVSVAVPLLLREAVALEGLALTEMVTTLVGVYYGEPYLQGRSVFLAVGPDFRAQIPI